LQYLAESDLPAMMPVHLPAEATGLLNQLAGDVIHLQQYLDFLKNTRFRQSLLCHQGREIDKARHPERLFDLLVSSPAAPANPAPDLRPGINEVFKGPLGSLTTATPLVKATMTELAEAAPRALPFMKLFERARGRLVAAGLAEMGDIEKEKYVLASTLLDGYLTSTLLELHVWQPHFVTEPSAKPVASPLARLQAQSSSAVTNVLHWRVGLHLLHQHLIRYLDGTRDKKTLVEALVGEVRAGTLSAKREGQSIEDPQTLAGSIEEAVVDGLKQLAKRALLVG
jgi:methyltransferase-like protein